MSIDVLQLKEVRRRMRPLIGLAILVTVAAVCKQYYVDEGSGGTWLLWNDKEAYCFNTIVRRGYAVSYLGYPWALLMEYLHAPELPDEDRWSLEVTRITSAGVERHVLNLDGAGTAPSRYTEIAGGIFANCQSHLCRWAGDHFEAATPEERERVGDTSRLDKDEDVKREKGWSKCTPYGPDQHDLNVAVGDLFAISIKRSVTNNPSKRGLTMYLVRREHGADKIGEIPNRKEKISRSEYRRLFLDG